MKILVMRYAAIGMLCAFSDPWCAQSESSDEEHEGEREEEEDNSSEVEFIAIHSRYTLMRFFLWPIC